MTPLDIIKLANERAAETGDNLRPEFHDAIAAMLEAETERRSASGQLVADTDPVRMAMHAAVKHATAVRHMHSTQLIFLTLLNPAKQ